MFRNLLKYIIITLFTVLLTVGSVSDAYCVSKRTTRTTTHRTASTRNNSGKNKGSASRNRTSSSSRNRTSSSSRNRSTSSSSARTRTATSPKKRTPKPQNNAPAQSTPKRGKMSRQGYEKQQRDLKKQIEDTEKLISNNTQSVRSQNRDLSIRADEIRKRQALVNSKQQEINAIHYEEDSLVRKIGDLQLNYEAMQAKYAAAVCHLYKWRSGYDELLFILSAEDLVQAIRRVNYLRRYSEWRHQQAEMLEQQRLATEQTKQALAETRSAHETAPKEIEHERAVLAEKQQKKQSQVNELQKRNKELQKELANDRQRMQQLQATIQKMIEEEIRAEQARKEAEARRQEEARRRAEANRQQHNKPKKNAGSEASGSASGPSAAPTSSATISATSGDSRLSNTFAENKGRLPYPVDSNFAFVSHSGGSNYGIVLSAKPGAHARAIYDGTVTSVLVSKDEYTVIVQHGSYRSVYVNLKNVFVSVGQKVKLRQQLGTLQNDSEGIRSEIIFMLYRGGSPVTPESWLHR